MIRTTILTGLSMMIEIIHLKSEYSDRFWISSLFFSFIVGACKKYCKRRVSALLHTCMLFLSTEIAKNTSFIHISSIFREMLSKHTTIFINFLEAGFYLIHGNVSQQCYRLHLLSLLFQVRRKTPEFIQDRHIASVQPTSRNQTQRKTKQFL